jgi:hypothetical protein
LAILEFRGVCRELVDSHHNDSRSQLIRGAEKMADKASAAAARVGKKPIAGFFAPEVAKQLRMMAGKLDHSSGAVDRGAE